VSIRTVRIEEISMRYGTKGTMGVDYEERIDFKRLRREREAKIQAEMEKTDLSCLLLFDNHNKRYATSTAVASPEVDNMGRYGVVPRDGKPYIFGFGSEVAAEKLNCPWIADRAYPAHTTMYGALPRAWGLYKNFIKDLEMVLDQNGLSKSDPIGVDFLDGQLIEVLRDEGFRLADGMEVMLSARTIKTKDEIQILTDGAAAVDAAFHRVARAIQPGARENDIQAEAAHELHRLGCQWVLNVQLTSGSRTHPHPHLSSDRLLRPGDLVFLDIQSVYNGYQTCYYRTLCCGRPTQKQKDLYKQAYEWLMAGIDQIRPGNTTADIARVWPSGEELGFGSEAEAFGLAYAHGLGVGLWERPMVSRLFSLDHPVELQEGMVIAIECYAGEGWDGARIEEEVVVTPDGNEIITRFPDDELIACNATY
jgi:Xaa-Pro dipeptidase